MLGMGAFILNLLLLIVQTSTKFVVLLKHIVLSALSVQYILCRLEDVVKVIISPFKKLRNYVWNKGGDSHQDYTYHYSGMPGGLSEEDYKILQGKQITEEQYETVRKQL
jgi:hypothetical protein